MLTPLTYFLKWNEVSRLKNISGVVEAKELVHWVQNAVSALSEEIMWRTEQAVEDRMLWYNNFCDTIGEGGSIKIHKPVVIKVIT